MFVAITQQAYRNNSKNKRIVSRAKVARSLDFLVNAKLSKKFRNNSKAQEWAGLAIVKANEADQVDSSSSTKNETNKIKTEVADI